MNLVLKDIADEGLEFRFSEFTNNFNTSGRNMCSGDLSYLGFVIIGLPGASLFALLVLVFAIVQIPALLAMIPAIAIVFSYADTTPAIIFTIYIILVAVSDNFIKPMLLGKGLGFWNTIPTLLRRLFTFVYCVL